MKRFIISVLCVSVFFVGLGAIAKKATASFKSDDKALELVRKARQAIGGDNAINSIQGLRIVGRTTKTFKIDGVERNETGETEIAMQLPDKFMKMMKIGHGDDNAGGEKIIEKQVSVVVVGDAKDKMNVTVDANANGTKKIVIKKSDGTVQELTGADADKFIATEEATGDPAVKRIVIKKADGTTTELTGPEADKILVRTKEGGKVGEITTTDGNKVIIRKVEGSGDLKWNTVTDEDKKMIRIGEGDASHHTAMKQNEMLRTTLGLLLTAPQGMDVSYTYGGESDVDGTACNIVVADFAGTAYKIFLSKSSSLPVMMTYTGSRMPQMMHFKMDGPKSGEAPREMMVFTRKIEGPAAEKAEFSVKFSDYRSVGGVQLPYKWTQTVGGNADETFDVTEYEVNPPNIAEKFQNQKVMVRMTKPDNK